jgi:hypothetical protein
MTTSILALVFLLAAAPPAAKELAPTIYQIPVPPKPDFTALDWLIGNWAGTTLERQNPIEVRLSVSYDLDRQVMLFRGETSVPAGKTSPAINESWLGILAPAVGGTDFRLRTFSTTGFITLYRVSVEGPEVRFNPEGGEQPPPGWLFRTIIKRTAPQEFLETVQAAPPSKSFFDYYTARLSRLPTPEKPKSPPPAPEKPKTPPHAP